MKALPCIVVIANALSALVVMTPGGGSSSSLLTAPMINGDNVLIDRSSGGDETHWQRLQFCYLGMWDSGACATMPTVCRLLKGKRLKPFNPTPMAVNSISPAHLHVRTMGRTCR